MYQHDLPSPRADKLWNTRDNAQTGDTHRMNEVIQGTGFVKRLFDLAPRDTETPSSPGSSESLELPLAGFSHPASSSPDAGEMITRCRNVRIGTPPVFPS